jgi:hypothetical protein
MGWAEQAVLVLAVATAVISLGLTRLYQQRLRLPSDPVAGTVTLILPLTGEAPQLDDLLARLAGQTLRPRRLLIAVESTDDPAYARAQSASGRHAIPVDLIVAGRAEHAAQKCVNILAAVEHVDELDDVVVLLDGDIRPQPWWLAVPVRLLMKDVADLVTGYRWQMPGQHALASQVIAAIDRGIAVLPRLRRARTAWGGTLAMSRHALQQLDLPNVLDRVLSDDLAIATAAHERGLRLMMTRVALVPAPIDQDWVSAWRFGRRQYQIIAIYRPWLWCFALLVLLGQLSGWGVVLWHLPDTTAAVAGLCLFSAALLRQRMLVRIGRRIGSPDPLVTRVTQLLLVLGKPLVDLFHFSMVLGAMWPKRVAWGHVEYAVHGPTAITVVGRRPWQRSRI